MRELLIRDVGVLRCEDEGCEVVQDRDILIRGNRIAEIGPKGTLSVIEGGEVIDGQGMLAMPGLINTHAHVPMTLFRGLAEDVDIATWFNDYIWPLESNLTEDDVFWGMQLGLAELIEAGVTSVADHYFHMDRVGRGGGAGRNPGGSGLGGVREPGERRVSK